MTAMRLIIAILFSGETKERIASIRDSLHEEALRATYTKKENLHLTLEFLGELPASSLGRIRECIDSVECGPFRLTFRQLGRFRRPDGDTWYLAVDGGKELKRLQADLHKALLEAGFKLEKRPYTAHVTLARRVMAPVSGQPFEAFSEMAGGVSLMLSERIDGQMVYTELYRRSLS